jgi:two-component system, chemotaxis family, protein-glutamate methylesterase/glutaminase
MSERIVVVGSSAGGTDALKVFLSGMPVDAPAILITQHIPETFSRLFAERMNSVSAMKVCEAEQHQMIQRGHAYIAPGHSHLALERFAAGYRTVLSSQALINRHRPSVEFLFRSAAQHLASRAIGVMLTGMGKDGAAAMLEMKHAGAYNFAQDEASCVVFGMPREAIVLGAVDEVVPLPEMAQRVLSYASQHPA